MITRDANEDEINWVVEQSLNTPAHIAALLAADAALLDYSDTARSLDKSLPVLQVVREEWSETALKWLAKNTPSAKTEVLGEHMMFWEFPDQFNQRMLNFLGSI